MTSVDLSTDAPDSPAVVVYDPGDNLGKGVVQGVSSNESRVMRRATLLEVEQLAAGTVLSVQVKNHPDMAYKEFTSLDGAVDTEFLVEFLQPYNFMKIVRTGATDPVASAQFGNVGHGAGGGG